MLGAKNPVFFRESDREPTFQTVRARSTQFYDLPAEMVAHIVRGRADSAALRLCAMLTFDNPANGDE